MVAVALLSAPGEVAAHEGDPRLLIEPPTVAPGGAVRVIGEDLEPGLQVQLTVEGIEQGFAATTLVVDPAGHFTYDVALPPGLGAGVYGVKAETGGELVASDVLVVDEAAGPGIPVDRSPPWAVLVAVLLGVVGLLVVLRLRTRRGAAAPDDAGRRPGD